MNVIILDSKETSLPSDYTAFYIHSIDELNEVVTSLRHQHIRPVVLNTCANAVIAANKIGLSVINKKLEFMYSVDALRDTDEVSDIFYTEAQLRIASIVESISSIDEAQSSAFEIACEVEKHAQLFSEDTLSDIIISSAKELEIAGVIKNAIKKRNDHFEEKVRLMILPAQAETIDNQTYEPSGFVVNTSEMGTSKSESNMKLFDKAIAAERKPMLIVPNISLTNQFSMRDEHYKNICDLDSRIIKKMGAITTINSARIPAHHELNEKGDVVIFDEAVKTFEHMNGDAFFDGKISDRKSGFEYIFAQMKKKDVVISDAHFGQAYIDIVSKAVGRKLNAVEMPRGSYSKINVHAGNLRVQDLVQKAKDLLRDNVLFAFYCDRNKQDANAIYKEISEYGMRFGLKSIMMNAAEISVAGSDADRATVVPDQHLKDYSVIFFTPALGPGFSARLPEVETILMDCCGTISPISLIQTTFRFRCVKDIYMAFSIRKDIVKLPENRSDVCYRAIESSELTDAANSGSLIRGVRKLYSTYINDPILCAAFDFKALENWSRNRYRKFVITAMKLLGFNMKQVFSNQESVANQKLRLSKRIKNEKEEARQYYLCDEMISSEDALELRNKAKNSDLSLEELRKLEKYEAGSTLAINGAFNLQDFEFIENNGLRVISYINVMQSTKQKGVTIDRLNKNVILNDIHNYVLTESNKKTEGFQNDSLVQFMQKMKSEKLTHGGKQASKLTVLKHLFLVIADTKDPRKGVNAIISLLGYKLRTNQKSKVRIGGERKNVVLLDSTLYDQACVYMNKAEVTNAESRTDYAEIDTI